MNPKPSTLNAERLRCVNELLEVALSLPESARAAWLKGLPGHQQPFVATLSALLGRAALETDDFLRRPVDAFFLSSREGAQGPAIGDAIGPYRLVGELGAGGMATVWLAERADGLLRRQVALKLPHVGWGSGFAQRMARERDILAALEHPHIARLYDAGVTDDGRPWMAMEHVTGSPIDIFCAEAQYDIQQRLRLFLQVLEAVAHAHAHLVVHRDLKPSNILVTAEGDVRLLDFGVAKLLVEDSSTAPNLTQLVGNAATPDYASPEQVGSQPIGVATDVYSLGIVLYELLTGTRPYSLGRLPVGGLEKAILAAPVPAASTQVTSNAKVARQLRGDIDTLLAKALRKDPRERYASVESFAADITRHLAGEPLLARAEGSWYRAGKFLQRNYLAVIAVVAILAALLVGLGAASWQAREAMRQSNIARDKQVRSQASADFALRVLTEGVHAGESLTLDKLIERSQEIAEHDFSGYPIERTVAADTVADWLINNERIEPALSLLNRAIDELPNDVQPALRQTLRCQRAGARMALGDSAVALAELDEVTAQSRDDAEVAWYCLQRRTSAAIQLNDAKGTERYAQEALHQFALSGNDSPLRRAYLVANQAYAEMLNGRPALADARFREAIALLTKAGRADSNLAVSVYNDWGIALWNAGDPRAGLVQLDRAIKITLEHSPDGEDMASHYGNRGHTLRALGRLDEALASFLRMRQVSHDAGNRTYEVYALAGAAVVGVQMDHLGQSREFLSAGENLQREAALSPDVGPSLWLKIARATLWQAEGQLTEADRELAELQQQYLRLQTKTGIVAEVSINRAEIAIAQGRLTDAERYAKQALNLGHESQGDMHYSFITGRALLALAKAYQAKGDLNQARTASREASENLRSTLGDSHALSQEAKKLMDALKF